MPQMFKDEEAFPDNEQRKNLVFMGYPFSPPLPADDYRGVVKDLQEELPIRFWYFLDEVTTSEMMRKVWRAILRADLGVFDVSGGNANVAFELGLAVAKDRRCMTLLYAGQPNPLGSADLGYAERMDYTSVQTFKSQLRAFVVAKSSALRLLDDLSYAAVPSDESISREDALAALTKVVTHVFNKRFITKTATKSIAGSDAFATSLLTLLRANGVLKVEGIKGGARWTFTDDWVYADHEVAGDI